MQSNSMLSAVDYTPDAESDRVRELPGWGPLTNVTIFAG